MKNIWFITNKYFVSNSFIELKKLIYDAAKNKNINLYEYNNVDIINIMSKNNYEKPDCVLFWDKDVKLAKYIENENIKVFNNSEAIRICDDKSLICKYFENMHRLFIDISAKKLDNISMDYLSMGMSDDYCEAIMFGANMVRVGSALFGKRIYADR